MRLLVFGATGTSGAEVIRQAILDPEVTEIYAVVRRPLKISNIKLKVIEHENFLDYSNLFEIFKNIDICAWCLGVSQTQVNSQELHIITFNYTLAGADAILKANPKVKFLFQSGAGADLSEKSSVPFEKEKGMTENALIKKFSAYPWAKLFIARPAGIQPIHLNKNTALVNKFIAPFYPLIKFFAPKLVITSVELAKAILNILKYGYKTSILTNQDLKNLATKK